MSLLLITANWQTSSTIGATGATTLVTAPGTNQSLLLDSVIVTNKTTTTGIVEGFINQTTTVGGIYFTSNPFGVAVTGGVPGVILSIDFTVPWILETNAALSFIGSISASSTPALYIFAKGRILKRGEK